ncbi:MAG: hypothetical protein J6B07_02825 [Opitutales bacterium]|nr:hypothetical protein [Opitutales bacterium]
MDVKKYLKNIKSKNTYNPFGDYIKASALLTRTPVSLYDDTVFCGASAVGLTNPPKHHIFDRNLFPLPNSVGHTTTRLAVSQEVHCKFHQLIANAKCYEDFLLYERTVKSECPKIVLPIAQIYIDRIAQLRTGPIVCGLFVIQKVTKMLNKIFHK